MRPALKKIVLRRESESTRKRRQQLAKDRQGQDGKWESNKKKAAFRLAKRRSLKVDGLLQQANQRWHTEQREVLREGKRLAMELREVGDEVSLLKTIAALELWPVSAKLMKLTLMPRWLSDAAKKYPRALKVATRLQKRWREIFRTDMAKQREAVARAGQAPAAAPASAPAAGSGAVAAGAEQPRVQAAAARSVRPAVRPAARPAASGSSAVGRGRPAVAARLPVKRQRSESSTSSSTSSSSEEGSSDSSSELAGAAAATPPAPRATPAVAGLDVRTVATPQGKPIRKKPPRQLRLTAFLKTSA